MGIVDFFSFSTGSDNRPLDEIPNIYPLEFTQEQFVEIDTINIYQKVLTDVLERTYGLSDEQTDLLYDNCIQSEASHGLISHLARAMAYRRVLFLVYDKALNVLRLASSDEQKQIQADYSKMGKSKVGVYISFQHYLKSDLVRFYSALEYISINSLYKSMSLSVAVQIKMNDLRQSTGLSDSAAIKSQAQKIAKNLSCGKDVLLDGKDSIENTMPDLTAIDATIKYLSEKKCFYLGLPRSYITGEQTGGIGSTGEGDTKATERGLKNYFQAIIRPSLQAIFEIDPSYKSQDFRQVDQGINALKTFSLVDEEIISLENKTLIINKLFDLPEDAEGDRPEQGALPPDQVELNNAYPQI